MSNFVRRQIDVPNGYRDVLIIRNDELELFEQAENIIKEAQDQSARILFEAENEAKEILEHSQEEAKKRTEQFRQELETEAWKAVSTLLDGIKTENEALWDALEQHANAVVNDVLSQLLEGVSEQERIAHMLNLVVRQYRDKTLATLFCCPENKAEAENFIATQSISNIDVNVDRGLSADEIKLVSGMGELYLNWSQIKQALFHSELITDQESEFI